MAPIICSVLDSRRLGVQGVDVILECYDLINNCSEYLNSITDHNGEIDSWFPLFPSYNSNAPKPKIVHTTTITRTSMTFFPHPLLIGSAPWTTIRTDAQLGVLTNHVILHLSESPRLEYRPHPPANPAGSLVALRDIQTPSPLQLPSPVAATCNEQGAEAARVVGSGGDTTAHQ